MWPEKKSCKNNADQSKLLNNNFQKIHTSIYVINYNI